MIPTRILPALLVVMALFLGPLDARAQAQLGGCSILPNNNIWNTAVDRLPVHPLSDKYIETNDGTRSLHPDFSSGGGGIPINVVPATQAGVAVTLGSSESDPGPYPIPQNIVQESGTDQHLLLLQSGACKLYELYAAKLTNGVWSASSGAIFDLSSNALRPAGWTSADAAGLPILPGLVRYDEVASGEIRHAIRLTVPKTRREYVWPARHYASSSTDTSRPPMGQRFRLKASYDISSFAPEVQVILRALKKYGMILADNGSSWYITGAPDSRWNDEIMAQLKTVKGSDLEAVDSSSLMISPDSGLAGSPVIYGAAEVSFSPTPEFNLSDATALSLTLTADVTQATAKSLVSGQITTFIICQDGLGGHGFVWPTNARGAMTVGADANTCSAQQFVSDGTLLWAISPGVANMPR